MRFWSHMTSILDVLGTQNHPKSRPKSISSKTWKFDSRLYGNAVLSIVKASKSMSEAMRKRLRYTSASWRRKNSENAPFWSPKRPIWGAKISQKVDPKCFLDDLGLQHWFSPLLETPNPRFWDRFFRNFGLISKPCANMKSDKFKHHIVKHMW